MKISLIICAYNEEEYIGRCVQSVLDNAPENLLEVIVINNASTDHTAEVVARFPSVRVVNEPHKGLTRARQRGLVEAKGDVLGFLDADTKVTAEWFKILNKEFISDPKLVCLSGPYIYEDLSEAKLLFIAFWYRMAQFFALFTGYLVQGGNFVAKKQALLDIGGFDTSIEFYGEDTNIARRLHEIGKVKFTQKFKLASSSRRLGEYGLLKIAYIYGLNFFSEIFVKRPATKKYNDIR